MQDFSIGQIKELNVKKLTKSRFIDESDKRAIRDGGAQIHGANVQIDEVQRDINDGTSAGENAEKNQNDYEANAGTRDSYQNQTSSGASSADNITNNAADMSKQANVHKDALATVGDDMTKAREDAKEFNDAQNEEIQSYSEQIETLSAKILVITNR